MEMAQAPVTVETAAAEIVVQLRGIEYVCRQLAGIAIEPTAIAAPIGTAADAGADDGTGEVGEVQSSGAVGNGKRAGRTRAAKDRSEGQPTLEFRTDP
jgi:hypothetical protein